MSKVHVEFDFEPEGEDADDGHESGLSEDGFNKLTDQLMSLGAENIETKKA